MEKMNIIKHLSMSIEELEQYYKELRKYNIEQNNPIKGVELRKKINKTFLRVLKLVRFLNKQKLTILNDKRTETNKPKIFAVSHIGRYDIEIAQEVVKDPCFFVFGDPGDLYKNFDGLLLYIKGIIYLDTRDKEDRQIGYKTSVKALNQGTNILIFPEGAWNISPNEIIYKIFPGTIKMALETGAEIIPIAIEQYDNDYVVNIGENIVVDKNRTVKEQNDELRDTLASLKWEIWEQKDLIKRADAGTYDEFLEGIMKDADNNVSVNEIHATRYKFEKPDEILNPNIEYNKDNAFLLKRNY